ncbi:GAF domain-containing protein [Ktedonosporobacter rubrisoli]|uniref:GAF domain-containing protein n=1 Tax=Ktedonosporobacter rubrisoli TaxID=2509675 RepID=A0A4P6JUR3_KTERU|nr:GAF domain-containing protein [Ktedonosporobacter rubrisoli]QBD79105.1 GAF domain-containing protein [Ktedonosporobacter rubrisoli]
MTTDSHASSPSSRPHRDYYTALYQAALTISSSLELDQVLESVVKSITEAMQVKACVLRLLDPETGQLRLSAESGLSGNYLAKGPVDVVHSAIDSAALGGSPVFIPDVRTDTRFQYQEAAAKEGIVSVLCVPLEVRGEAIGVLRVYTNKPAIFHEDDIQFLSVLASLAALAIENARLYEGIRSSYHGVMDAFWGTHVSPS